MLQKGVFSFLILVLNLHLLVAQINVQWGAENKQEEKGIFSDLYINSQGTQFSIIQHKSKLYVKKHDEKGNYVQTLEFDYKTQIQKVSKLKTYFNQFFFVNDKVCIVTFEKDSKQEKFIWRITPINTLTMQLEESKQIHEMSFLGGSMLEGAKISISPNHSKIVLGFNTKGKNLDDINYLVKILDVEFNTLWQRKIAGVGRSFFKTIDVAGALTITDNEVVCLFQKQASEGIKSEKVKFYNRFNVFTFSKEAQVLTEIEVPVGGFYSKNPEVMVGTFLFKYFPNTAEFSEIKVHVFDDKTIEPLLSQKENKQMGKIESKGLDYHLPHYRLDAITETPAGDIKIIAERYYIWQSTTFDFRGNMRTITYYVHGNILLLSYNSDFKFNWSAPILKFQETTDGGYWNSYAHAFFGENVVVVFTDNPENLIKIDDKKQDVVKNAHGKRGVFVGIHVSKEGKIKKYPLYEVRDVALFTLCTKSAKTNKELVLRAEKGYVSKLVSFSLRE